MVTFENVMEIHILHKQEITERWLTEYNSKRPHESLNNLTPEEYRLMAEKTEI